jgi:hypothetical protein
MLGALMTISFVVMVGAFGWAIISALAKAGDKGNKATRTAPTPPAASTAQPGDPLTPPVTEGESAVPVASSTESAVPTPNEDPVAKRNEHYRMALRVWGTLACIGGVLIFVLGFVALSRGPAGWLVLLVGGLQFMAGLGLRNLNKLAWIYAVVNGVLLLFAFPAGTVVGGLMLYYMIRGKPLVWSNKAGLSPSERGN